MTPREGRSPPNAGQVRAGRQPGSQASITLTPPAGTKRIELIDALRGFALYGILLMNLGGLSLYGYAPAEMRAVLSTAPFDRAARYVIVALAYGKFNTLFSFLFGLGFSLLLVKEGNGGSDFARYYRRRLGVLIAIGAIHLTFLYVNDVLAMYGLIGLVLLSFRRATDRTLLTWAVCLLLSQLVVTSVIVLSEGAIDPGISLHNVGTAVQKAFGFETGATFSTFAQGSVLDVIKFNAANPFFRYGELLSTSRFQRVLAMFLVGLVVGRRGFLQHPEEHKPLLRRVMLWGLAIGLVANTALAFGTYARFSDYSPWWIAVEATYVIGVVPLSMAYVAAFSILWLHPRWQPRLASLVPAGRMALTNYVMQSVICIILFYGIGFGLGGKIGPTWWFGLALVIVAAQAVASRWWLRRFRSGPLEWIWRSLAYGPASRRLH